MEKGLRENEHQVVATETENDPLVGTVFLDRYETVGTPAYMSPEQCQWLKLDGEGNSLRTGSRNMSKRANLRAMPGQTELWKFCDGLRNHVCLTLSALVVAAFVCAPSYAAGLYERAEQAVFARKYDEAIELYKQSMSQEQDKAAASAYQLFNLYKRLRRYDDAAQYLKQFEHLTGDENLSRDLADLYRDAGRHYEAQGIYQQILSGHPNDGGALYGMAVSLEATGNFGAARDYYSRLTTLGGTYGDAAQRRLDGMQGAESGATIDSDVRIGRWPTRTIKVFVVDGSAVPGYRGEFYQMAVDAVTAWSNSLHGVLTLEVTNEQNSANIEIGWVRVLQGALGLTVPDSENGKLTHAHIYIALGVDSNGRGLPPESTATRQVYEARDRMLHDVSLHELGHALGLTHSPRADDIMANGIFGLTSSDVTSARQLAPNDVARVVSLYANNDATAVASGAGAESDMQTQAAPGVGNGFYSYTPGGPAINQAINPAMRPAAQPVLEAPVSRLSPEISEAMVDLQSGRYEASKDCLSTALNRNPNNPTAHYLMAVTMVNLREYNEAAKHYREVLKLVPAGQLAKRASDGLAKVTARISH